MPQSARTVTPDGPKCRRYRKRAGLTLEDFQKDVFVRGQQAAGISAATAGNIERGKPCFVNNLAVYAAHVGADQSDLILDDSETAAAEGRFEAASPDPAGREVERHAGRHRSKVHGVRAHELVAKYWCDFAHFIDERREGFVGRSFLRDALRRFFRGAPSGYFLVTGPPGIGKSAFLADLVQRDDTRTQIYHFNRLHAESATRRRLLGNVCARLIRECRFACPNVPPDFRDSSEFLSTLLRTAAKGIPSGKRLLIAIDALDEMEPLRVPLLLPAKLPNKVYFILTARHPDDVSLQAWPIEHFELKSDAPENTDDVAAYIRAFSRSPRVQTWMKTKDLSVKQFVALLVTASEGNFMYLRHVLPEIERGRYLHGGVDELPHGLRSYYRCHWDQMQREDRETFSHVYEPVICFLAAAEGPVEIAQLVELTKLDRKQIQRVLRAWRAFLPEERRDNRRFYRLYHTAFRDFLAEEIDPGLRRHRGMIIDDALERIRRARDEDRRPTTRHGLGR